jgi:phage terminase small subunit
MASITAQKQRFIEAYLISSNATQSAIDAGYSKRTASVQASRMLKEDVIQDAIQDARHAASERNKITVDHLIDELEAARQIAKDERNASAMISATLGKAKILGLDKPSDKDEQPKEITITVVRALVDPKKTIEHEVYS